MELHEARRVFSRVGFSLFAAIAAAVLLQLLFAALIPQDTPLYMWIVTFIPMYAAAIPLAFLILRGIPAAKVEQNSFGAGKFFLILLICIGLMYAGNIAGNIITTLITLISGGDVLNPILSYAMDGSIFLKILIMVILGPLMEELLFRKMMIDRLLPYGEKTALITSAVAFGLFHGNLSQFFYAAALGLALGYVYLRTGKLRWSYIYHMIINFLGSIVAPAILSAVDLSLLSDPSLPPEELLRGFLSPGFLLYLGYSSLYGSAAIAGIVFFFLNLKKVYFRPTWLQLPQGKVFSTVWCNAGMILFFLSCLGLVLLTFISV